VTEPRVIYYFSLISLKYFLLSRWVKCMGCELNEICDNNELIGVFSFGLYLNIFLNIFV